MAETQFERLKLSLLFEVLQATAMLLFTLSSIASNRRKQWNEKTGSATVIALPGLPELLCLEIGVIRVPDEDLYGPRGTAAQMAYTGWTAGVLCTLGASLPRAPEGLLGRGRNPSGRWTLLEI